MQRKLPRALRAEVLRALGDEVAQVQVIVHEQATPTTEASFGALITTHTKFIHVAESGTRTWGLREVGLAEHPEGIAGKPVSISVLAGDELLRFTIPNGVRFEDVLVLAEVVRRNAGDAVAARIEIMPWWEAKALWPYATKGRVAGGTTLLEPGTDGSLGVGRRGVSFYPAGEVEPVLQFPWAEITDLFVEGRDDLSDRLTHDRLESLGLLHWAIDTKGGESFVTVLTKHDELFFAAAAPPDNLTFHWEELLDHFSGDPLDKVEEKAVPVLNSDLVSRLERLNTLHAAGSLTDAEFTAAKDALLGDD
jgi:hypothetical protein